MDTSDYILEARRRMWTPTSPQDLETYWRTLDYEKPGDEEFLQRLGREAGAWLQDNFPNEYVNEYWEGLQVD